MGQKKLLEEVRERSMQVVQVLSLPKDVVLGSPLVSAVGTSELYVENFLRICVLESGTVKILTRIGMLCVEGAPLKLEYYTKTEIKLSGMIRRVSFDDGRRGR